MKKYEMVMFVTMVGFLIFFAGFTCGTMKQKQEIVRYHPTNLELTK